MGTRVLVDIHTHVYLPRYVSFLRSRKQVPRISTRINTLGKEDSRLHILPDEPSGGRPVGPQVIKHSAAARTSFPSTVLDTLHIMHSIGIETRSSSSWIHTTLGYL